MLCKNNYNNIRIRNPYSINIRIVNIFSEDFSKIHIPSVKISRYIYGICITIECLKDYLKLDR